MSAEHAAARRVGEIDWASWQAVDTATLVFVLRDDEILLIDKKRGLGKGKVNGPGGKVDPGETIEQCAIRECREELSIEVSDLQVLDDRNNMAVNGVSLTVRRGEIVGIAGVQGNGQTELVEALTGLRTPLAGEVRVKGEDLTTASPRAMHLSGVAHVLRSSRSVRS